jgi:hypothetical protein
MPTYAMLTYVDAAYGMRMQVYSGRLSLTYADVC